MDMDFENVETPIPSLTLEPELEAAPQAETLTVQEAPAVPQPVLTPAEQKMVSDFAAEIGLESTTGILQ